MGDYAMTYLALGGGTQSGCLMHLACEDKLPTRPDVAIFADTGDEPSYVNDQIQLCVEMGEEAGIPVIIGKEKRFPLGEHLASALYGVTSISTTPMYTRDGRGDPSGVLMRKCSRDFKIRVIERAAREETIRRLGLPEERKTLPKGKRVLGLVGISSDEADRMKPSRTPWLDLAWPLIDMMLTRKDCVQIVKDAGLPPFERSACIHCPYHGDAYWIWLRDNHPKDWRMALHYDRVARALQGHAGITDTPFLHPARIPLGEVRLGMWKDEEGQQLLWADAFSSECEGICGV